eukprot:4298320-Karenia_brevis.AAC.1
MSKQRLLSQLRVQRQLRRGLRMMQRVQLSAESGKPREESEMLEFKQECQEQKSHGAHLM